MCLNLRNPLFKKMDFHPQMPPGVYTASYCILASKSATLYLFINEPQNLSIFILFGNEPQNLSLFTLYVNGPQNLLLDVTRFYRIWVSPNIIPTCCNTYLRVVAILKNKKMSFNSVEVYSVFQS